MLALNYGANIGVIFDTPYWLFFNMPKHFALEPAHVSNLVFKVKVQLWLQRNTGHIMTILEEYDDSVKGLKALITFQIYWYLILTLLSVVSMDDTQEMLYWKASVELVDTVVKDVSQSCDVTLFHLSLIPGSGIPGQVSELISFLLTAQTSCRPRLASHEISAPVYYQCQQSSPF